MRFAKIAVPLATVSLLAAGCGNGEEEAAEEYPTRPIELIVSFAAGGGTDVGARQLMPLVEDELDDADIQVVNRPGAGGWVGWDDLVAAEPDGYTLGYINTPSVMSGYLNPDLGRDNSLDDFTFIANQVTDPLVISIRPDEDRFDDFESLMDYAQENALTATSTGVAGHQHTTALRLNQEYGANLEAVHTDGAAESMTQFLGGHIDLLFNTAGEVYQAYEQGELEPVAVMAPERSEFLDGIPTVEEAGFGPIYGGSSRGVAAPADLPEDLLEVLSEAFEAAITSDEHMELMADQGLYVDYMGPEEYREYLEEEEATLRETFEEVGWSE